MSKELKEIKERAAKATPGEWRRKEDFRGDLRTVMALKEKVVVEYRYLFGKVDEANLDFIAHARTDIPYLLRRLEAAEAVAEETPMCGCENHTQLQAAWQQAKEEKP